MELEDVCKENWANPSNKSQKSQGWGQVLQPVVKVGVLIGTNNAVYPHHCCRPIFCYFKDVK